MRGRNRQRYDNLSLGLNTLEGSYIVDSKYARDLLNVVSPAGRGSVKTRDGCSLVANVGGTLTPTSCYVSQAISGKGVLAGSGKLQGIDFASGVTAGLGSATGLTDDPWDFVEANTVGAQGPVFGMNGSQARYWNGTAFAPWTAVTGTIKIGKYLAYVGGRIFVAGVPGSPYSVFSTDLYDPTAWPGNEIKFDPGDGDPVTGLGVVGSYLLVFKGTKAYVVYDTNTGANRSLGKGVGCLSHRSIATGPHGCYFLSAQGVYRTDGHDATLVSKNINPTLDAIPVGTKQGAVGAWWNNRYELAFPAARGGDNTVLDLDELTGGWWKHRVEGVADLTVDPSTNRLYGASSDHGELWRLFVPGTVTDASLTGLSAVPYWTSPWYAWGQPYLQKRVRQIVFDMGGKFDLQIGKNFAAALSTFTQLDATGSGDIFGGPGVFGGPGIFGGGNPLQQCKAFTPGVARAWSIQLLATSASQPFEVDAFTFVTDPRSN